MVYSVIRYNVVVYNVKRHTEMQCNVIRYSVIVYNVIRYNVVVYNVKGHTVMQCNVIRYSVIVYNANVITLENITLSVIA